MKKPLSLVLLVALTLALAAPLAWAGTAGCVRAELPPETREALESLRATFKERLAALREQLMALRGTRDFEAMQDARQEMQEVRQELREAAMELLPEELREQFMAGSPQRRLAMARRAWMRGRGKN